VASERIDRTQVLRRSRVFSNAAVLVVESVEAFGAGELVASHSVGARGARRTRAVATGG
jgi:hypothetical protein